MICEQPWAAKVIQKEEEQTELLYKGQGRAGRTTFEEMLQISIETFRKKASGIRLSYIAEFIDFVQAAPVVTSTDNLPLS